MLKNYFKTALRNFWQNPLSSLINILGLSVALGCAVVVYAFVSYDLSVDQFHEKKNELFLITSNIDREGKLERFGFCPRPMGEKLIRDFPQIRRMTRIENRRAVMKYEDRVFYESARFVDPDFLEMFTFPLKWGKPDVLSDPGSLILSEELSVKYFGEENPVGKMISLDYGRGKKLSYLIGGVAEAFPKLSNIRFSVLINIQNLPVVDPQFIPSDWSEFVDATFFELTDPSDLSLITGRMDNYLSLQNSAQADWPVQSFQFEALANLRESANYMRSVIMDPSDPAGRVVITVIGIIMICLACFNYINIAIVSASKRLKEIGMRKVMGSSRLSIIFQFIGENILLTSFASVIGLILAFTLFVPSFDELFSIGMEFNLWDLNLWVYLLALVVVTGIASGAYPAFYISKFRAINIIRGRMKFGKKNKLTRVFLTCQFILALFTVITGIMFVKNANYQKARDWGYDQKQILVTRIPDLSGFLTLRQELARRPEITHIAGSSTHLGTLINQQVIELPDRKLEAQKMQIDTAYIRTMGIRIKQGRDFEPYLQADAQNVIINETLADRLDWEEPIGKTFRYDSLQYTVIGVAEDYHHYSFYAPIQPAFFELAQPEKYNYLSLRVEGDNKGETFEYLERTWASLFPDLPFEGTFQEQYFDFYFENVTGHGKLSGFIAFFSVLLACFGLYGLVSLNVASRTREFSIRKVLGAGMMNLFRLINDQFIWLFGIALLIGAPGSYYLVEIFFDTVYTYHMPMVVGPVFWGMAILIALVFFTVSFQVRKVLISNPTEGLRNE